VTRPAVLAAVGAAVLAIFGIGSSAPAADLAPDRTKGCAKKFDHAQRTDMESFRDFDAETFRSVHASDAVSIFPTGEAFYGVDEIMAGLDRHFTEKDAVFAWTEITRRVDGCKSAYILYDATYDIPELGFHQRALTVVTYEYQAGRWLAIMDQGTLLELINP
jgi:Domain of unknown function (DUF4440)